MVALENADILLRFFGYINHKTSAGDMTITIKRQIKYQRNYTPVAK